MSSIYYYTARSPEGKFVRGSMESSSRVLALSNLRARFLFVTSLEASESAGGALVGWIVLGPVKHSALVLFFRSFATLIGAGVSVRRSLEVTIQECQDGRLREALSAVQSDVESGFPLSSAMARRPREFPRLFVAMLRAGELGGTLDETLERLATIIERDRSLRKRVAAALTYPCVVALGALALTIFLLTSIIPMFASLFFQMHVQLPATTALLLRLSAMLSTRSAWIAAPLLVFAIPFAWVRLRKAPAAKRFLDAQHLRLPIFGTIARKTALARMARMLGSLLRSGVDLIPALEVVTAVVGNAVYERSLVAVSNALAGGQPFAQPLEQSCLYDPTFLQMVRVGEETGALDRMLLRIAEYYEVDVETALTSLGSVLEPLIISILGLVIGVITASIYIPLYSLIGNLK